VSGSRASSERAYTLLELLLAMAIFTFLGAMVVYLMRNAMNILDEGRRQQGLEDRKITVLPEIVRDLTNIAIPYSLDAPPSPPSEAEAIRGVQARPAPPVDVRVRSGFVVLRDVPEGPLKDAPCPYVAFVTTIGRSGSDRALRAAGNEIVPDAKPYVPEQAEKGGGDALLPTGGLLEVCYVAVALDPAAPSILTLFRGFRSPVGGPDSLLEPENLDTLDEIQKACRVRARGLLHFGVLFRRVFATSWVETVGPVGETDPYVGRVWDSTRARDPKSPLYKGPQSLGDPSDDVTPRWARVEITLMPPSSAGMWLGETELAEALDLDGREPQFADLAALAGSGAPERHLKIGREWMAYRTDRLDFAAKTVRVERAVRGTVKARHEGGSQVYVGIADVRDVRIPVFLDRFAREAPR
jgi:hypothetical protein